MVDKKSDIEVINKPDLLRLASVSKYYKSGDGVSVGMQKVSLSFNIGEFVAITGESGSGKSTLLNVIAGLDGYEDGEFFIEGEETSHFLIKDWEKFRSQYIGFIFQSYNIIDSYTVYQNVMLALEVQNYPVKERRQRALALIEKVGLLSHKNHKAAKLSGGQKQRAVIARALAKDCPIIVADEPTGNLDSESSKQIIKLLSELKEDKLVLIVTHNYDEVKDVATRKIMMSDGEVIEDKQIKKTEIKKENTLPKHNKMSIFSVMLFALRNLLSTPKRLFFFIVLQIAIIVIFTVTYANFMNSANNIEFGFSSPNYGANELGILTRTMPDNRFYVLRKDNQTLTEADYAIINGISNDDYVYKNILFFEYQETMVRTIYYENDNRFIHLSMYEFNDANILRQHSGVDVDSLAPNEIFISNGFEGIEKGSKINVEINGQDYRYNLSKQADNTYLLPRFDIQYLITYTLRGASSSQSLVMEKGTRVFNPATYNINHEDIIEVEILYFLEGTFEYVVKDIVEDNQTGSIYFHQDVFSQFDIVSGLHVISNTKAAAERTFNEIDKSIYRVIYPVKEVDATEQILGPLKFLYKVFFYILTIFIAFFLYFLLFMVMKNVMRARIKDFAIYRSIGANELTIALLVIFEQLIIMVIAYIIATTGMFIFASIDYQFYIQLNYLVPFDYVILFITLALLSVRLAAKFNKKTFKISVIENLSQSKEEGL